MTKSFLIPFIVLFFSVLNGFSLSAGTYEQEFAGGSGTASDPWLIETAEHLNNLRNYVGYDHYNRYFRQTADILLNVSPWNEGEGWLPIGGPDHDYYFMGQYDADGHYIIGLTINRPDESHVGLFGGIAIGEVKNLVIINPEITGGMYTGALVGQVQSTSILNCAVVGGTVTGTGAATGGFIGMTENSVIVRNSFSAIQVSGISDVGGIAGRFFDSQIYDSYNRGSINGNVNIGGLAGNTFAGVENAIIKNSYSAGYITGEENTGGLIGYNSPEYTVETTGSFWDTEVSEQEQSAGGTGLSTDEMTSFATFIEAGWDFKGAGIEEIWNIGNDRNDGYPYHDWQYPGDPAPDGPFAPLVETVGVSYYNITHESAIVDALVILAGNPSAVHGVCWNTTGMPDLDDDCTDEGIVQQAGPFTSLITGLEMNQNYFVRAYVYNDHGTHFGKEVAFTTLAMEAVQPAGSGEENDPFLIDSLPNLLWMSMSYEDWGKHYLQTSHIDATETAGWNNGSGWMPVGNEQIGFTGRYNGNGFTISNLFINRPDSSYQGFMGYILSAEIINLGLIDIEITGNVYVGGLTGRLSDDFASIQNCFTTGSLSGSGHVGGLAGNYYYGGNNGGIRNSYSNAHVTGDHDVGGLLGSLNYGNLVENSYSTGLVEGNIRAGGLIGYRMGNAPQNSYWDTQTSGQDQSAGGHGLSTSQMTIQESFNGWNFDNTWEIDEGKSYPYLQWQQTPGVFNYPPMPLIVLISPENTGTVIIDPEQDQYHFGDNIELTAIPQAGYKFQNWYKDGVALSPDAILEYEFPGGEVTLTAGFIQEDIPLFSLGIAAEPLEGGIAEGGGNFHAGETVQVRASPVEGYHFVYWTDPQGNVVSTQQEFGYPMPSQNTSLTANFSLTQYQLHVEVSPLEAGYVTVSPDQESFNMGDEITLIANAEEGYVFLNWTDQDGNPVGDADSLVYTMPAHNVILIANFELQTYSLSWVVNPEEAGYIEVLPNQDYYVMGDEIFLDAYPNEGYFFVNWTDEDGNEIYIGQFLFYVMPAHDVILTANFDLENPVSEIDPGGIVIFPNPAWDYITIESENNIERIFLLDLSGKVLKSEQGDFYHTRFDLSDLPDGIYILKLETSGGFVSRIIQVVKH